MMLRALIGYTPAALLLKSDELAQEPPPGL